MAEPDSGPDKGVDAQTRLAVHINPNTKAAIERLVVREGITQKEAVRRLIGYGDMVYRTTQIEDAEIFVRRGERFERVWLI